MLQRLQAAIDRGDLQVQVINMHKVGDRPQILCLPIGERPLTGAYDSIISINFQAT
jgi:hypothetical protein